MARSSPICRKDNAVSLQLKLGTIGLRSYRKQRYPATIFTDHTSFCDVSIRYNCRYCIVHARRYVQNGEISHVLTLLVKVSCDRLLLIQLNARSAQNLLLCVHDFVFCFAGRTFSLSYVDTKLLLTLTMFWDPKVKSAALKWTFSSTSFLILKPISGDKS